MAHPTLQSLDHADTLREVRGEGPSNIGEIPWRRAQNIIFSDSGGYRYEAKNCVLSQLISAPEVDFWVHIYEVRPTARLFNYDGTCPTAPITSERVFCRTPLPQERGTPERSAWKEEDRDCP